MEKNLDDHFTSNLLSFLDLSPTAFQAAVNVADVLNKNGFRELKENESWQLEKGGKYYLVRNQSSVVAFEVGAGDLTSSGFRIIASHSDSPSFKVKPGRCLVTPEGYIKLNVEAYGGAIYSTWFDRPLAIAGRAYLRSNDAMSPASRLVNIREPVALIPNLCIHLNREINAGCAYNIQADMLPMVGKTEPGENSGLYLVTMLARHLGVAPDDIIDYELYLYEAQPGCRMGASGAKEYISASRIDNLASVFASLGGIVGSCAFDGIKVMAALDNEEVGSVSIAGASGNFLISVLKRFAACVGLNDEDFYRTCANSIAISADAAHAVHPNHSERHDPENRPVLGGGPTIKYNASQRYATNARTAAIFSRICASAGIPIQKYANRSDLPAGSTIGPSLSSMTSIPTVDVGVPILAMHSIRELGNAADVFFMAKAFQHFFGYSS